MKIKNIFQDNNTEIQISHLIYNAKIDVLCPPQQELIHADPQFFFFI